MRSSPSLGLSLGLQCLCPGKHPAWCRGCLSSTEGLRLQGSARGRGTEQCQGLAELREEVERAPTRGIGMLAWRGSQLLVLALHSGCPENHLVLVPGWAGAPCPPTATFPPCRGGWEGV